MGFRITDLMTEDEFHQMELEHQQQHLELLATIDKLLGDLELVKEVIAKQVSRGLEAQQEQDSADPSA